MGMTTNAELLSFAEEAVLATMIRRLPPRFTADHDSTRQAVRELLAEANLDTVSLPQLHHMAMELIDDWHEYQEDEGHIRDYPITD